MDNKMPEQYIPSQHDSEIDLRELFAVLWASKIKIVAITTICAIVSVFYALSIPNQYKATVLVSPAKSPGGGITGALGSLGGLANLAGVSMGGGSSETQVAKEIMRSWSFTESFIENNNLAVGLSAAYGWDKAANKLLINTDTYDPESEKWLSDAGMPSSWALYKAFSGRLTVSTYGKSGLLSVSIEYYSPLIAKQWLDLYIAAINEHMQKREMAKVTRNIEYLQAQIKKTNIAEMQEVFYTIIEEQIKSKMLAEASPEYAFVAVSPSMVPAEKSQPRRSSICILGTLLGGMLSVLLVLLMHYGRKLAAYFKAFNLGA
jgi:LPS O-antigen subunit length determinant protein (WzzB/FepE family)